MNWYTYLLRGFGFKNTVDFSNSINKGSNENILKISIVLATIREYTENIFNIDAVVILAFVLLIIAEWHTGIKVDMKIKKSKFRSRKVGRMIFKICTYIFTLWLLSTFANKTESIDFKIFEINPMQWLYYVVFTMIIFQLLVSYFENLSSLGYKEMNGIIGVILRKGNKWFEFDGQKDADKQLKDDTDEVD